MGVSEFTVYPQFLGEKLSLVILKMTKDSCSKKWLEIEFFCISLGLIIFLDYKIWAPYTLGSQPFMFEDAMKMPPRWPKMAQDGPKIASRWPQDGLKMA